MMGFERFAFEAELVSIGPGPFGSQKSLDPVTQDPLSRVFAPPGPVHRPVAGRTPGVEGETGRPGVTVADKRTAVKMGIVGSKPGMRIGCFLKKDPAGIRRFGPKDPVCFRPPSRPQLIKSRQV